MHELLAIVLVHLVIIDSTLALTNTSSSCGQTSFTEETGTIRFSAYTWSRTQRSCTYLINTSPSTRLILRWTTFNIAADMPRCIASSVTVYLGCGRKASKLIDFCSKNVVGLPHDIYTRDNCLKLVFHSSQTSRESFTATYRAYGKDTPVSTSTSCPRKRKLYSKSDVIYTPLWPTGYPSLWYDCEWEIKVPSDYVIKFSFMDLDIYKSSSTYYSCQFRRDNLKLEGEKSVIAKRQNKEYFCGEEAPFTRTTRYYQVELEFKTGGSSRNNRGVVVGYIAYKTPESSSAARTMNVAGYVGIVIAILVIITCCSVFAWRRRRRAQSARQGYVQAQTTVMTSTVETKPTTYGTGIVPPQQAPPSYSTAISQPAPGYQGQPAYPTSTAAGPYPPGNTQPYPQPYPAPYPPTSNQPYPPASAAPTGGAPYPSGGAPYPSGGAPYPSGGAPYPTGEAPYPAQGAPYPTQGAPYATGAPTIAENKQASAPPM